MIGVSGEPQRNHAAQRPPFPLPRWARVVAFIGLYVLTVIGLHELEDSLESLLGAAGLEGASLYGVATVASLFIAFLGLANLLYADGSRRNRGLYMTACSLVSIMAAFAVATATVIALRATAPDIAGKMLGQAVIVVTTTLSLAAGALATIIATRRRERDRAAEDARPQSPPKSG